MDDNIQFQNMDSWKGGGGKFGLTFKQITLEHIRRCVVNGSCEWHGGYWNETGTNPITRTYVPNSRDVYCNSVRMLRACLLGYFDKPMEKADKELQEQFEEAFQNYHEELKKEDNKSKYAKAEYYEVKVDLYIKLFEELIRLSKRLNFFEEEATEEEM